MNPKNIDSKKWKINVLNFRLPSVVRASRQTAEPTELSPRFVLRQAKARTIKRQFPSPYLETIPYNTMIKFIRFVILKYEVGFAFSVARHFRRKGNLGCGKARRLHT